MTFDNMNPMLSGLTAETEQQERPYRTMVRGLAVPSYDSRGCDCGLPKEIQTEAETGTETQTETEN